MDDEKKRRIKNLERIEETEYKKISQQHCFLYSILIGFLITNHFVKATPHAYYLWNVARKEFYIFYSSTLVSWLNFNFIMEKYPHYLTFKGNEEKIKFEEKYTTLIDDVRLSEIRQLQSLQEEVSNKSE